MGPYGVDRAVHSLEFTDCENGLGELICVSPGRDSVCVCVSGLTPVCSVDNLVDFFKCFRSVC